ncbi:LolA family protein [Natrinema caseinilyticum]|uniref:LolA family protein n=1 Tax=Natrinema caseinilyticum TaxID=2961570 RepID=UPI0020C55C9E|nr:DUF2092 domain-containing protein [Natrinema caseinilyticum]
MANRRHTAVLGLLALMVLLSGCSMISTPAAENEDGTTDTEPNLSKVFDGAYVHADDLEDVQGTRTNKVTNESETVVETVRVKTRPYINERTTVLDSADSGRIGNIYVSNATKNWFYYPDSNTAEYFVPDELFDNEETRSARAETADETLDKYNIEYRGTEQVANRETHVLDLEAKNETVEKEISAIVGETRFVFALETSNPKEKLRVVEQRLWIDTEYDYPLKEKVVFEEPDGERIVMTEQFESVTFNTGLDDETFSFQPLENATVRDIS